MSAAHASASVRRHVPGTPPAGIVEGNTVIEVSYRRWRDADSVSALTLMLHRAYRPLAEREMPFTASHQTDETTRYRIGLGETLVAVVDERVIGCVTVHPPASANVSAWYLRPDVASIHQLAVDPGHQGHGIARALMSRAEDLARAWDMRETALDTCEHAHALIETYEGRGSCLSGRNVEVRVVGQRNESHGRESAPTFRRRSSFLCSSVVIF